MDDITNPKFVFKYPSALIASKVSSEVTNIIDGLKVITSNIASLTSIQHSMLLTLINYAQKHCPLKENINEREGITFSLPITEITKLSCFNWMRRTEVLHNLVALADLRYEYNALNKDKHHIWAYGCIITDVKINSFTRNLTFSFNLTLQRYILHPEPGPYAKIDLLTVSNIAMERADMLYCWLFDYLMAWELPKLTIENFRLTVLKMDPKKHKSFKSLRSQVIDPIKYEVNSKTDLVCDYELSANHYPTISSIHWSVMAKPGTHAADVCIKAGRMDKILPADEPIPDESVDEPVSDEHDELMNEKSKMIIRKEPYRKFIDVDDDDPDFANRINDRQVDINDPCAPDESSKQDWASLPDDSFLNEG